MDYVLDRTLDNMKVGMRNGIDISIRKTLERIQDFDGDLDKSREIFTTLTYLQNLRKQVDGFKIENTNTQENIGE